MLKFFSNSTVHTVAHEEAALVIIVQLVGLLLIISCVVMFIRHESLHRLDHILQMNILFCSTFFLLVDWILLLPGISGCEAFSFVFLTFGSACTFSAVGIAMGRFRKMMRLSGPFTHRKYCIIEMVLIWLAAFLLVAYPISLKVISQAKSCKTNNLSKDDCKRMNVTNENYGKTICFFQKGSLYTSVVTSLCFSIGTVLCPLCLIFFCYVKIFDHLRKARLNAWLNYVAHQRSQQTQVIQCKGRKANVFQITSDPPNDANAERFNRLSYKREKSVFLKGLAAVSIILLCWAPLAMFWVYISLNGFDDDYMVYVRYLMINAKLSVILNISHYIVFNVKFKRFYFKTVFGPIANVIRSLSLDWESVSHIQSQTNTLARSNATDKHMLNMHDNSRTPLDPISELQTNNNLPTETPKLTRTVSKSTIFIQQKRSKRSLPDKFFRRNTVEPCVMEKYFNKHQLYH